MVFIFLVSLFDDQGKVRHPEGNWLLQIVQQMTQVSMQALDMWDSAEVNLFASLSPRYSGILELLNPTLLCNYGLTYLKLEDDASAWDEGNDRVSPAHLPVWKRGCWNPMLVRKKTDPGFACELIPVFRWTEGQLWCIHGFQLVMISWLLLYWRFGLDSCPRGHPVHCRTMSSIPGLCPSDANSTTQPLHSHERKNISRCCQMFLGRQNILCLRTTGSDKINSVDSLFSRCLSLVLGGQEGVDESTRNLQVEESYLERGSHARWEVCLFRFRGLPYLGTLFNGAADYRLRAHYSQIARLSLLIRRAFIWNLFLVSALFEENSEWGHRD